MKNTEKLQESFVVMFVLFAFVEPTDESLKKTSIMKEREGEENGIKFILEFECNWMVRGQLFLPSKWVPILLFAFKISSIYFLQTQLLIFISRIISFVKIIFMFDHNFLILHIFLFNTINLTVHTAYPLNHMQCRLERALLRNRTVFSNRKTESEFDENIHILVPLVIRSHTHMMYLWTRMAKNGHKDQYSTSHQHWDNSLTKKDKSLKGWVIEQQIVK